MRKTFICTAMVLLISTTVSAHPGRLDSTGGHNVLSPGWGYPVGSYHYHQGNDRETAYDENNNIIQKNALPTTQPADTYDEKTIITVIVDGELIEFEQPPEIINNSVMVPIRNVAIKMGCLIAWDNVTQTVYINEPNVQLHKTAVKTDNINVYVNNKQIEFGELQPVVKNGSTLLSVRFVAEELGYTVEWDGEQKIVYINKIIVENTMYVRITNFQQTT